MTLTLELAPEEELQLELCAGAQGLPPSDYVRRLLMENLQRAAQRTRNQAAIGLLQSWREADTAMSEQEAQAADAEWRESMLDLDKWRSSDRKLFPHLSHDKRGKADPGGAA